ncbi:CAP domain-containing protein [Anaerocolumna sp.]|uniref:CAP domain-containing protein n=1 Tax=Anaerocolumna sp. TaxID=2041569 RepID=UPI0028A5BE5C|nr:CAP domain-containing protein [Anaerocolumna sp.]
MKGIIVTSLLSLQIAGLFGGNASTNSNININELLNKNAKNINIELAKDAISKCTPSLEAVKSTDSSVQLDISKEEGVDGYSIYRTSKDGISEYVGDTKSGNFTDKNLDSNSSYCYTARAYAIVNGNKVISPVSNKEVAVTKPEKNTNTDKKETTTPPQKETAKPEKETPKAETPKAETPKAETPKTETPKTETPKTETPKAETPKTEAPKESTNQYDSSFASQVLKLVNIERTKGGLQELTMSSTLTAPANKRAQEIKTQFSHTRPNGTQWSTVLDEYGISVRTAGENLAYGYNTPEAVVQGWMNSPGHRANIMNGNFNQIGIGVYKDSNGTVYCTQLFSN